MFWFVRYRFLYPAQVTDASLRLKETLQQEKWRRVVLTVTAERVKLQHKQPFYFYNYWNPIFDGKFVVEGGKRYLNGYFRPGWLLFTMNALTIALAAYHLVSMWSESSAAGLDGWLRQELHWQVSLVGVLVLLMLFGWLIGVPYQRRILAAIRESATSASINKL